MRFLFASDSTETQKDGWAIDNLWFEFGHIGVEEIHEAKTELYPNPTSGIINFNTSIEASKVVLLNYTGSVIDELDVSNGQIDLSSYPVGYYSVRWRENGYSKFSRLIVQ